MKPLYSRRSIDEMPSAAHPKGAYSRKSTGIGDSPDGPRNCRSPRIALVDETRRRELVVRLTFPQAYLQSPRVLDTFGLLFASSRSEVATGRAPPDAAVLQSDTA